MLERGSPAFSLPASYLNITSNVLQCASDTHRTQLEFGCVAPVYLGKTIAAVIPAYNEERLIGKTLKSVPPYVDRIYVVDDSSTDGTQKRAEAWKIGMQDRLTIITHEKNRGVGAAIVTGYKKALEEGADIAVVLAGDAQMDTNELPRLLDPLAKGYADYSKGNRLLSKEIHKMPRYRQRGNALLTMLTKIGSGYWDVIDPQNGYAAITRHAMETIDLDDIHPRYGYCNDILVRLNVHNFRVVDVVMPPVYGEEESGIRLRSYTLKLSWLLLKRFFWRIWTKYTGEYIHPVFFFYVFALILLPIGLGLGGYVLYERVQRVIPTVGTTTLIALLIALGMQFFSFALLFDEMSARYQFRDLDLYTPQTKSGRKTPTGEAPPSKYRQLHSYSPTLRGLFARLRKLYWGLNFHPLVIFYFFGMVTLAVGFLLAAFVLNHYFVTGLYSEGTINLVVLLLILGTQSFLFGVIFEMQATGTEPAPRQD